MNGTMSRSCLKSLISGCHEYRNQGKYNMHVLMSDTASTAWTGCSSLPNRFRRRVQMTIPDSVTRNARVRHI